MPHTTLLTPSALVSHLSDPSWVVVDCRFSLQDTARGERDYLHSHIPSALYAHLDRHLAGPVIPGVTGRHPWLSVEQAASLFSSFGISPGVQVVAYDDAGGALAAVRLWYMLRWLGHDSVAILDGGWQRWLSQGLPQSSDLESRPARQFIPHARPELLVSTAQVDLIRLDPAYCFIDARLPERYHGQNETIDPVAGHIPGARNAPYADNLTSEGVFKSIDELRAIYSRLLGDIPPENTVFYCGSGVTSILNILAMLHAGLGEPRLYAGSWSEWIADPSRPIAT